MKVFSSSYFFLLLILLHLGLWFVVKDDPFFGDSIASTSKAALAIYDSGFQTIFYPESVDPGHPTLWPFLVALCWKIFGLHLWVSHFVGVVSGLFLLFCLRKLFLLVSPARVVNILLFVSSCFATYLSMNVMMLNTTLLMALCVLAVYAMLADKKIMFMGITSLMMLTHLQASYFLAGLIASDYWITVRQNKKRFIGWMLDALTKYTAPIVVFMFWLVVHYQHTGWLVHSPNYSDADSIKSLGAFVKSIGIIFWRLLDYGMLPVHCITIAAIWRRAANKKLATIFCVMLAVTVCIMAITLEHTIGHRYFLVFQLVSIGIAMNYIATLQRKYFVGCTGLIVASLLAGNFLFYPGKTLGDATLAYRSYFAIEKQIERDFTGDTVYSYAPIANPIRSKWLESEGLLISRIASDSLSIYPIILESNLNAEFTKEQRSYLATNWYGKSYEQGAVFVTAFLNPAYYSKPTSWTVRKPSWFEQKILEIKNRFGY